MPAVVDDANGITLTGGTTNAVVNSGAIILISGSNTLSINVSAISIGNTSVNTSISVSNITFSDGTYRAATAASIGHAGLTITNTQTFTGSGTWIKPVDGKLVLVRAWGAGGSGARVGSYYCCYSGFQYYNANGGAGGGFNEAIFGVCCVTSNVTVTIGAGGNSRTTNAPSLPGGNTSFGSYVIAAGGGSSGNLVIGGISNVAIKRGQFITKFAGLSTNNSSAICSSYIMVSVASNQRSISGCTIYGGGSSVSNSTYSSTFGGGSGGSIYSQANISAGVSTYAGNGGNARTCANAVSGFYPAGGGGAVAIRSCGNIISGAGANGQVIVYVYS